MHKLLGILGKVRLMILCELDPSYETIGLETFVDLLTFSDLLFATMYGY